MWLPTTIFSLSDMHERVKMQVDDYVGVAIAKTVGAETCVLEEVCGLYLMG